MLNANQHPFQTIIDLVKKTGLGFKEFMFRTNIVIDHVLDSNGYVEKSFPGGLLIIKFSDGNEHLGSMALTRKQVNDMLEQIDPVSWGLRYTLSFSFVDTVVFKIKDADIKIHLTFFVSKCGVLAAQSGKAIIEVVPKKDDDWYKEGLLIPNKKLKQSSYPKFYFTPVREIEGISVRLLSCLKALKLEYGWQLPIVTIADMDRTDGFGDTRRSELSTFLQERGSALHCPFTEDELVLFKSKTTHNFKLKV